MKTCKFFFVLFVLFFFGGGWGVGTGGVNIFVNKTSNFRSIWIFGHVCD